MADRKKIALIYTYNENWIGGTYYIENLINALSRLPDNQLPELVILSWQAEDAERLKKAVQYPYWSFRSFERKLALYARIINKVTFSLTGKRSISALHHDLDLVFPISTAWLHYFNHVPHHLYWVPDFQEHYLPAFFEAEEIEARKAEQHRVIELARHIVFSSYAVQADFNEIYAQNKLKQHILQFAVSNKLKTNSIEDCLHKYNVKSPYFICSNQFWKHKNHPVILQALARLRQIHKDAFVVFTGKEHDYRNPTYFEDLIALRDKLGLQDAVKFLGFISREDQLTLMQGAISVIQPSLFEGWSTVVEDAKSLGAPLIVSAIDVHLEQLSKYESKLFFPPENADELADVMYKALSGYLPRKEYMYDQDVSRFGKEFIGIVDDILSQNS